MSEIPNQEQYTGKVEIPQNSKEKSTALVILSIVVVLVATIFLGITVYNFVENIQEAPKLCEQKCNGNDICETNCALQSSVKNFVFTVLIFLFILILLGTYFVIMRNNGD